jgi:hypothetical protein
MTPRTTEIPHNTPAQVREYLREALAVVEELELDDDLKVPAFLKAVDLIAAKQLLMETIHPGIPNLAIPGKL